MVAAPNPGSPRKGRAKKAPVEKDPYDRNPEFRDFREFLKHVWKVVVGIPPTPLQLEYAWFLQHGGQKQFLSAYRGFGKSFIAVAFAIWNWYWNPDKKVLLVSASAGFSKHLSTFAFQIIRGVDGLQFLDCEGRERHSKIDFDVGPAKADKQPSCVALGITGQLTGNRADLIIADDVEVPNNSDTQAAREKLATAVQEFAAIIRPGGTIVYLGTPQTESSIYTALPSRGYAVRLWPIVYPSEALANTQRDRLSPMILEGLAAGAEPGAPTDPLHFDELAIAAARAEYAAAGFALQFQLDTSLANVERYPLKLKDLMLVECTNDLGPEGLVWRGMQADEVRHLEARGLEGDRFFAPFLPQDVRYSPWQGCLMFVDPAGSGKDETAYAVVKHLNGILFAAEVVGMKGGHSEGTLAAIAAAAARHKVNKVVVEANFGDGMYERLLEPHLRRVHPCAVEGLKVSTQKELRILDTLEPIMAQHRLAVDPSVFERDNHRSADLPPAHAVRYLLSYQLTRLTRDRGCLAHDDRVDALAGAVALWIDSLARDVQEANARSADRLEEKELWDFVHGVSTGERPPPVVRGGLRHNRAIGGRRGAPFSRRGR